VYSHKFDFIQTFISFGCKNVWISLDSAVGVVVELVFGLVAEDVVEENGNALSDLVVELVVDLQVVLREEAADKGGANQVNCVDGLGPVEADIRDEGEPRAVVDEAEGRDLERYLVEFAVLRVLEEQLEEGGEALSLEHQVAAVEGGDGSHDHVEGFEALVAQALILIDDLLEEHVSVEALVHALVESLELHEELLEEDEVVHVHVLIVLTLCDFPPHPGVVVRPLVQLPVLVLKDLLGHELLVYIDVVAPHER